MSTSANETFTDELIGNNAHPATLRDGRIEITLGAGTIIPVLRPGIQPQPAVLGPGWQPAFAFGGFVSFIFLELHHASGKRATWILNSDGIFIADKLVDLSPAQMESLRQAVEPYFCDAVRNLMVSPETEPCLLPQGILDLNGKIQRELAALAPLPVLPPLRPVRVAECSDLVVPLDGSTSIVLSKEHLAASISGSVDEIYLESCRNGNFSWRSPVDGNQVPQARGLVISTLITAWRCVEPLAGFVYYIFVTGFDQDVAGLYIPATGDLVCNRKRTFTSVDLFGLNVSELLIQHVRDNLNLLPGFIASDIEQISHFTWPAPAAHLGHYIWNELTGIASFVSALDTAQYPLVIDLGGAGGGDYLGPLQGLFPELRGFVIRGPRTIPEMVAYAYQRRIQVLRFSGSHVTSDIRCRVRNVITDAPQAPVARQALARRDGPIVLFGLRVENRTITEIAAFYIYVAKALQERFGRLTIVIDGHNGRNQEHGGGEYQSFLEGRAGQKPIDIERSIVHSLKDGLKDLSIAVVDCVGMTVQDNMAWVYAADMAVAPWGAGLAKYRWLANLPSYVLASRFNQSNKTDLNIYHDKTFMEKPSSLWFVPTEAVEDLPEAEVLVKMDPIHVPYYTNYAVDFEAATAEIGDRLRDILANGLPLRYQTTVDFAIENDVMIGVDDELYLANGGHRVIEHALGLRQPPARSFRNFEDNLKMRAMLATELGARYLHVVFPDKQSVLPERIGIRQVVRLGELYSQKCGPAQWENVLYPIDVLRMLEQPFLRTDTHMTIHGTLSVVKGILWKLYQDNLDYLVDSIANVNDGHTVYVGDLGRKLQEQKSERKVNFKINPHIKWLANNATSGNNGMCSISLFTEAAIQKRLVFFGDSFGRDCCTILAHLFREVIFLRSPFVHSDEALGLQPDVMISGNVERYLAYVAADTDAPTFQAMQWMKNEVEPDQRTWAEGFSALMSGKGGPYRRWINQTLYGAR